MSAVKERTICLSYSYLELQAIKDLRTISFYTTYTVSGRQLPFSGKIVMALYSEALVIYQTRKTVFDHISRYREEMFEDRSCGVLPTNFEVFGNVVKHCLSV